MSRTIILELNELSPDLIDRFIAAGELPHFAALKEKSEVYRTWTDDEPLEPWVQWISYHYGLPQSEHGVRKMNQGKKIGLPALWDKMAAAGYDVFALSPMNAARPQSDKVSIVPDPWTTEVPPSDPSLAPICDFIGTQVREHANPDNKIGPLEALRLLLLLVRKGMSPRTALAAARQIMMTEPFAPHQRWRRAMVLDRLLWDLFETALPKQGKAAGMIFLDATGHYQHRYWRHAFPEDYQRETTAQERKRFGGAIAAGYRLYDGFIERAMRMAGEDGTLVLVSALTQECNLRYDAIGGKIVYRPRNYTEFVHWAGCRETVTTESVMAHQAWAVTGPGDDIADVAETLKRVRREDNGDALLTVQEPLEDRVFFYCKGTERISPDLMISTGNGDRTVRFGDLFTCMGEVNSSKHKRDGVFWVMGPKITPQVHDGYLPLEDAHRVTLEALDAA